MAGEEGVGTSSTETVENGVNITTFTEDLKDYTLHFQIIRLHKQLLNLIWAFASPFAIGFSVLPYIKTFIALRLTRALSTMPSYRKQKSYSSFDQPVIFAWIGCNSARLGHMYAAAPIPRNSMVSVASILGGTSDNTGSSIARRLVLKTGLNIVLACNIPKNSPMLEADAERILVQKLVSLGYTKRRSQASALPLSETESTT